MHATPDDLGTPRRWGALTVASSGAVDGSCPPACARSHWGYVIRGSLRVTYPDHAEVVRAGAAYYVAPGHHAIDRSEAEVVEFTTGTPPLPADLPP